MRQARLEVVILIHVSSKPVSVTMQRIDDLADDRDIVLTIFRLRFLITVFLPRKQGEIDDAVPRPRVIGIYLRLAFLGGNTQCGNYV